MTPSSSLDRLVGLLKWPVAVVGLVLLPGVCYALAFVARDVAQRPASLAPALVGAGIFFVIWRLVLLPDPARHRIVTSEHELTHALFALLTLHRVSGVRAALAGGGHVRYVGRGNWLIAIAPYTVPLFALVVLAFAHRWHELCAGLLGAMLAWNVVANWSPALRHHGDHREAGRLFAFVVIACANLLLLGIVLAYATGARSLTGHLAHVRGPAEAFVGWIVHRF